MISFIGVPPLFMPLPLIIGIGCIIFASLLRPTHTIRITTSAGQAATLKSKDEQYVKNIIEALNKAIAQH